MDYSKCDLCPRKCYVNRETGQTGYCGTPATAMVAKAMLHQWEEPVLAPNGSSGAIFFGGCTLGCKYCQNRAISAAAVGEPMDSKTLRSVMEELVAQGAENIDLVTPTHYLPTIIPALSPKLSVPVIYNCGGYERVETLRKLDGLVDVYLPDLKYADNALAAALSGAPDYFEVASAAIREMARQTGSPQWEGEKLVRGTVIRHLILPGQVENSLGVLEWIGQTFAPGQILFSLMSQYVPCGKAKHMPGLDRPVTRDEYDGVLSYMELLGIEDGFTQEFSSASEEYIPDWNF